MISEHENPPKDESWYQDQVPPGHLADRTTNERYPWEGLQTGQTDLQPVILGRPHNLRQRFMGGLHPAPFDVVDDRYMPSVPTSHIASYMAGENEENQE
jgi:hypothetical protein